MTFGRIAAGMVVGGWLGAAALAGGCSQPDLGAEAEAGADADAERARDVGPQGFGSPAPTATTTATIPLPQISKPGLDTPKATCAKLAVGSTFEGYLIEPLPGASDPCPMVYSSYAQWRGDLWTVKASTETMPDNNKSFFVGAPGEACIYYLHAAAAGFDEQDRYEALMKSLGNASRAMLGINCDTLDLAPANVITPPPPAPPINFCRKCGLAQGNAVAL